MKKKILIVVVVLAVMAGFWLVSRRSAPVTSNQLKIVVASWPAYVLTKPVAGELAQVTLLGNQPSDPHNLVTNPAMIKQLALADVVVRQGTGLEPWLNSLLETAGNTKLKVIDLSEGSEKIMDVRNLYDVKAGSSCDRKGGVWNECGPNECQASGGEICPQMCGPAICQIKEEDPHLWLDPVSASLEVKTLGIKLTQITGDSTYQARALEQAIGLASLVKVGTDKLAGLANKKIIVQHPFLAYLAKRLGLTQLASFEETPGQEPSAKDLARIASLVKRHKIKSVFVEPEEVEPYIENFAKEINLRLVPLDPMERGEYVPDYYQKVFEANINSIIDGLK
ncbi:zinc ABC transporter substrate-binding protein [Candidatus Uhrbacteria bacterium]|nr:zinc ABC transporter substrate-binding protein [Candidatus Uhrbacteria bacterium]